jgi:hypothetical protein
MWRMQNPFLNHMLKLHKFWKFILKQNPTNFFSLVPHP